MYWSQVPLDTRNKLLAKYERTHNLQDDADALGMKRGSLERQVRGHRENFIRPIEVPIKSSPIIHIHQPRPIVTRSTGTSRAVPLTDFKYVDPKTDQRKLVDALQQLRLEKGHITVAHLCDIHFPFQHEAALDVTYKLVHYTQPDLIAVGSDTADFSILSTFEDDPDEISEGDVLDELEGFWDSHINALNQFAPDAVKVFILGNHENRIYRFIMRQAPQIRRTVWNRFREIVSHHGDVLWIGEEDTFRVGPLLVTHGNRVGTNPAKGLYDDVGGQLSVMAGHVHRLSSYTKRGEDFLVECITSGCLTNYAPYHKRQRSSAKWQLGTALAEVDLQGREVQFHNLKYELDPDRVWVRFERHLFEAPVAVPAGFERLVLDEEYS